MAQIILSAKSASDWTENELTAFNISVVERNAQEFFGHPLPDQPQIISPLFLESLRKPIHSNLHMSPSFEDLFKHLEAATNSPPNEESAVNDFAVLLLRSMGYTTGTGRLLSTEKGLFFPMCGVRVEAKPDVSIVDQEAFLLLVQEDKRKTVETDKTEPQLVAEAIAAFHQNNQLREARKMERLSMAIIPGIIMVGSAATFYKISISQVLVTSIALGEHPTVNTVIEKFVPEVPSGRDLYYKRDGMFPLENRRIVLRSFEAFKQFVGLDWT